MRLRRNIRIEGLMTLVAINATPLQCRSTFARLRELRDKLRAVWGADFQLPHLSMGMSNDFEIAIKVGATIVRIGMAVFNSRNP